MTHAHTHTQKYKINKKNTMHLLATRRGEKKRRRKKEDFIPGDRLEPPSSGNYRSQLSQDLWAADSEDSA